MHGPPGCGKTLLANAIAGELDVAFLKISAPEIVSGMSGESEQKVQGGGMIPLSFNRNGNLHWVFTLKLCRQADNHCINSRRHEALSMSHEASLAPKS